MARRQVSLLSVAPVPGLFMPYHATPLRNLLNHLHMLAVLGLPSDLLGVEMGGDKTPWLTPQLLK